MDFNLESAQQFAEALRRRNKNFKVEIIPMITEVLTGAVPSDPTVLTPSIIGQSNFISGDVNSGEKVYYYGILTVGDNVDHAKLLVGSNEVIKITKNSQIVDFFTDVKYYDSSNVELVVTPNGHFRGFQLVLSEK